LLRRYYANHQNMADPQIVGLMIAGK
jgi:hypothetical protein